MADGVDRGARAGLARAWARVAKAVAWTPPTSTEIGQVGKAALAAGLAWWITIATTDVPSPVLSSLAAIVVVQVNVRASVRSAIQRSLAVTGGILVALGIGDALALNGLTVSLLVAASLGIAQLLLRLPPQAARQVPISALVVLAAISGHQSQVGWLRVVDTLIGAAVGTAVSLLLPASRVVDARQTIGRLTTTLADLLADMGEALHAEWSTAQTEDWRRRARTARDRLVEQAREAVGSSREAAHWNVRDLRHRDELASYEDVLPRVERAAIGVWVIARGLDDLARLDGGTHEDLDGLGELLAALGDAVRVLGEYVLGARPPGEVLQLLDVAQDRRQRCVRAASRRAQLAIEHADDSGASVGAEGEWLGYVAALVQVDRIVADLRAYLPTEDPS